ncbi:MAG: LysR family transcriptional regulator [Reinekea sp.]
MLDRYHLTILQQVEQQGSLTAAAEKLCLTQSALSHAIKKLEQQLGTELWVKEGRRLRLTAAGDYLLNFANRVLPQFDHTENVIQEMAAGERGLLRIGMECHPCYQWLMRVIPGYLQSQPKVDMDVKQKFQFGGMAALLNYEIDLLVTPDPLQHPDVEFIPVFDYEQVLVVSPHNALAQQPFVSAKQIANLTLYTYPVDPDRLDIFTHFLLPANTRPRHHRTIEATEMMMHLVAADRGVASIPRWLAEDYKTQLDIQAVRLGKKGIQKKIYLGVRKRDSDASLAKVFVGYLGVL